MPADASKCRAIVPPNAAACGKEVLYRITFRDGDKVNVCGDCALYFGQVAAAHGTTVRTQRLDELALPGRESR